MTQRAPGPEKADSPVPGVHVGNPYDSAVMAAALAEHWGLADESGPDPEEWERRLKSGACTLADALLGCARSGKPLPRFVAFALHLTFKGYQLGAFEDLAQPFGVLEQKRPRQKRGRQALAGYIRTLVDDQSELGETKQDPTYYEGTAFHIVGQRLGLSPAYVFQLYYGKR